MADWPELQRELDHWQAAGRPATFWWRDDDAVSPTPALCRLLDLAADHAVPLSLAVIPRDVTASLAETFDGVSISVLQHGYAHANHAPRGEKKCELGAHRPRAVVQDELQTGCAQLASLFGGRFLPVLVPPWNRIDAAVSTSLGKLGYVGLSTYTPRRQVRRLRLYGILTVWSAP